MYPGMATWIAVIAVNVIIIAVALYFLWRDL